MLNIDKDKTATLSMVVKASDSFFWKKLIKTAWIAKISPKFAKKRILNSGFGNFNVINMKNSQFFTVSTTINDSRGIVFVIPV